MKPVYQPVLPPTRTPKPTHVAAFTLAEQPTEALAALILDTAQLAEFEAYLLEAMDEARIPGAAVALVQDGEVIPLPHERYR